MKGSEKNEKSGEGQHTLRGSGQGKGWRGHNAVFVNYLPSKKEAFLLFKLKLALKMKEND